MNISAHCPTFVKREILIGTRRVPQHDKQLISQAIRNTERFENASLKQVRIEEFVSTRDFFQTTDSSLLAKLADAAKPVSTANLVRRESEVLQDASGTNVTSFWKTESFIELAKVLLNQRNEKFMSDNLKISEAQTLFKKSIEIHTSVYVVNYDCRRHNL